MLNFGFNSNVNLGGDVTLTGGLSDDQVLWNFTSSGQNINLNNNASSYPLPDAFQGIILAPNDVLSLVNANLDGRVFGGDSGDMHIVFGDTINSPSGLPNTATVTSTNNSPGTLMASATIIARLVPQLAAGSNSGAGAGLTELLDPPGSLQAGQISFAVDLPQGQQAPSVQAAIANAVSALNAEVAPLGLSLVQVSGADAGSAQVHISFASTSAIGGVNQGIMVTYTSDGQITLINGWNWYFGSDAKGIAQDQYDFQTVLNHELGHVLGLGENSDPSSVMSLYLSPGQVRRDLTANDLDAIQQELQSSPAPLPASSAAAASGDALAVATASPSPVMTAASGLEPAAADPQGFSVPANSIRPDTVPPVVPGLETLGDSQELEAGPLLLPASPAAAAFGDALLVATASPSPVTAAVPQDFGVAANSTTLAPWPPVVQGLEIVENRGMTDRLYDSALAALTGCRSVPPPPTASRSTSATVSRTPARTIYSRATTPRRPPRRSCGRSSPSPLGPGTRHRG